MKKRRWWVETGVGLFHQTKSKITFFERRIKMSSHKAVLFICSFFFLLNVFFCAVGIPMSACWWDLQKNVFQQKSETCLCVYVILKRFVLWFGIPKNSKVFVFNICLLFLFYALCMWLCARRWVERHVTQKQHCVKHVKTIVLGNIFWRGLRQVQSHNGPKKLWSPPTV